MSCPLPSSVKTPLKSPSTGCVLSNKILSGSRPLASILPSLAVLPNLFPSTAMVQFMGESLSFEMISSREFA